MYMINVTIKYLDVSKIDDSKNYGCVPSKIFFKAVYSKFFYGICTKFYTFENNSMNQ